MQNSITLTFTALTENILLARLAAATIAHRHGFDIESIEDIKVAIGEAVTNAIEHGCQNDTDTVNVSITFSKNKLSIVVTDHGVGIDANKVPTSFSMHERGFGMLLIENLMDKTDFESITGGGTKVKMVKLLCSEKELI